MQTYMRTNICVKEDNRLFHDNEQQKRPPSSPKKSHEIIHHEIVSNKQSF